MNDFTLGLDEVSTKLDNVLLERLNELELKKKAIAKEIDDIKGRIKFNMEKMYTLNLKNFMLNEKLLKQNVLIAQHLNKQNLKCILNIQRNLNQSE